MECPECGYALSPFDKTCPRCAGKGPRRPDAARQTQAFGFAPGGDSPTHKRCPRCGRVQPLDAPRCENCGRVFQTPFPPPPAPQFPAPQPAPPVAPQPVAPVKVCPRCHQTAAGDARFCGGCYYDFAPPAAAPHPSPVRIFGCFLLIAGVWCAGYFFLFFDTSVPVQSPGFVSSPYAIERVNNLGLMADRQNGILIGLGMAILGALMTLFGNRK
ncbi:MAG: zinc ribbon domain-containing protein [Armatimonadetes bacterium]|nr:zinc ribbon domain-containing protein [Armatimonadota bacterium]